MRQDVDFVVGDRTPPPDEPEQRRTRSRLVPLIALGIAVLFVGGITIATLTHQPARHQQASPTPTPVSPGVPLAATGCPAYTACTTTTDLPAAVTAAVRAVFPRATLRYSRTLLGHRDNAPSTDLRQRTAVFGSGPTTVVVLITTAGTQPDTTRVSGTTRTVIRTTADSLYVTVQASGATSRALPRYDQLQRLVSDARLLAQ